MFSFFRKKISHYAPTYLIRFVSSIQHYAASSADSVIRWIIFSGLLVPANGEYVEKNGHVYGVHENSSNLLKSLIERCNVTVIANSSRHLARELIRGGDECVLKGEQIDFDPCIYETFSDVCPSYIEIQTWRTYKEIAFCVMALAIMLMLYKDQLRVELVYYRELLINSLYGNREQLNFLNNRNIEAPIISIDFTTDAPHLLMDQNVRPQDNNNPLAVVRQLDSKQNNRQQGGDILSANKTVFFFPRESQAVPEGLIGKNRRFRH
jgi:hypothetical protein